MRRRYKAEIEPGRWVIKDQLTGRRLCYAHYASTAKWIIRLLNRQ